MLLSLTKNCETLIEQIQRKAEETLEFEMIEPRETFQFKPTVQIKGDWKIGLTDIKVYNSFFNITEENKKFELYKFPDEKSGGISYEKFRDDFERNLDFLDITATDLQVEILPPNIFRKYRENKIQKG